MTMSLTYIFVIIKVLTSLVLITMLWNFGPYDLEADCNLTEKYFYYIRPHKD